VVGRELAACGYRVATVLNPIEALELILETKPDLVITAQVMPRMSGVDLACALAAMPATKAIPVALLTSLDPDHADLRALPMNVGLIRRGAHFGDDLADVLQRFNIT
jgi:CheY-like chemotaxis protein